MKNIRRIRSAAVLFLLAAAAAAGYWWHQTGMTWEELWLLLADYKLISAAVLLVLYMVKTVVWAIPLKTLYIGAGLLFDPVLAIAVSYAGLILQLTGGFLFGRSLGETAVRPLIQKNKTSARIFRAAGNQGPMASFFIRFIPGPPTDLTNMFLGTLDIPYSHYLPASLAGLTPTMLPVIFLGRAVLNPFSIEFLIPFVISASVLLGSIAVRRLWKQDGAEGESRRTPSRSD